MAEQQTKPSKTFILSLVFIALVIVAGAAILLRPGASEPESTSAGNAPSDTATAQDAEEVAGIEPSACGLAPDREMTMDTPPDQVEAVTVGLVKVPGSDTFGPAEQNNDVPTCWQYSEAGAVAAAYTFAATATDTARLTEGHLKEHLADGPGRDKMLKALQNAQENEPEKLGTTSAPIEPVGYRVLEFDDEKARVDVLMEHMETPGNYAAMAYQLIWQDGDWKLEVTETGENYSDMRRVSGTADFTMWEID